MSQLQELVEFLGNDNAVVKTVALQNLLGYSVTNKDIFKPKGFKPINDLINISQEKGATNQKVALTILVNVSDDTSVRQHILDDDGEFVDYAVSQIENSNTNTALFSMLLANLSFETNFELTKQQMELLLKMYVANDERHDYLSFVFVNFTNKSQGRAFFLEDDNLLSIIVFNESDKLKRKEASGKIVKNILFNTDKHMELLQDEYLKLLTYILSPLMSSSYSLKDDEELELPEDLQFLEDKKRETNVHLLETYLESLLLLCSTRPAREFLRAKGVYPVIRELHKSIEEERVCELCEQLVQFLMRDEEPEHAITENGEKIEEDVEESDDEGIVEVV